MNTNRLIEVKHDTTAKIDAAQGKPHNTFLWADEINTLEGAVRSLFAVTNLDTSNIASAYKKDLGTITGGLTFIQKINQSVATNWLSPCFVIHIIDGIKYVHSFIGAPGMYGTGQGQVASTNFILLEQSNVGSAAIAPPKVFKAIVTDGELNVLRDDVGITAFEVTSEGIFFEFGGGLDQEKTFIKPPTIDTFDSDGSYVADPFYATIMKFGASIIVQRLRNGTLDHIATPHPIHVEFELYP